MLEKKGCYQGGQNKPPSVRSSSKSNPRERQRRSIGLKSAFDVPLTIKLNQSPPNAFGMRRMEADAFIDLFVNRAIQVLRRMGWNTL